MRYVLYLCVLLIGCASDPYWVRTGEPVTTIHVHYVGGAPWPNVAGWTWRGDGTACDIYIVKTAPNIACIEAHERQHCAGYDHPRHDVDHNCGVLTELVERTATRNTTPTN